MQKTTSNEFIVVFISALIIGGIMVFLQPHIESWSNDQKFIFASVLAIVGWLILGRSRNKTRKRRLICHAVGNILFGVGVTILIIPLIKWI